MSPSVAATAMAENIKPWVSMVFAAALLYQGVHLVEHIAQVYQHGWLGLPILQSHGILFFFDLEWNHFVFNTLYLLGLVAVFFGARLWRYRQEPGARLAFWVFSMGGLGLQAYHQVEHTVRIVQHLTRGCQPCPGILGWYLDGVYLHFTFNAIIFISPLIAFFSYGFAKRAFGLVTPAGRQERLA